MNKTASGGYIGAIDGLRAVAVIGIILFHLDADWLPGGFVGVDAFFVISGFIVAYSVGNAPKTTLFGYFAWFYRRRILRIYPVLLVFVLATLAASTLFVPLADTSKFIELTGASAVFGMSNMLLLLKTGDYFAAASEYNPFTHTWSLGIEEQYYLLFPFFSYAILFRRTKNANWWLSGVITASLVSLALCAVLTVQRPEAAFYLLPTRFWELGLGFLLYVMCFDVGRIERQHAAWLTTPWIGWAGATGVAASLILADASRFPFPWALVPTFATAAVIMTAVATPAHPVSWLLSRPAVRWVGVISFSLYLWHWPVIVMMKWTVGMETLELKLLAGALILCLSVLSFYLVEVPFRRSRRLKLPSLSQFYAGALASLSLVAGVGVAAYVYKPALSLSVTAEEAVWNPYEGTVTGTCGLSRNSKSLVSGLIVTYAPDNCELAGPTVFVMGDSHAGAYNRMFERLASEDRLYVVNFTMGGCKLIDGFDPEPIAGCPEFRDSALAFIEDQAQTGDVVFFAGHYTRRYRDAWHLPLLENAALRQPSEASLAEEMSEVSSLLSPLLSKGLRILVEGPKPISRTALFRCADWFTQASAYCATAGEAPRDELLQRSEAVERFQVVLAEQLGLKLWRPFDRLCPAGHASCPTYSDGRPIFYDTDHLSAAANDLLLPYFREEFLDKLLEVGAL